MTRLSIIVPATGPQESTDSTLVSVLENRPEHCEIILAHAPGYEDPYDLKDEVRFAEADTDTPFDLLHCGIAGATGDIVHWLSPGVTATEGWTDSVIELFETDTSIEAATPTLLHPNQQDRILACGIRYGAGGGEKIVGRGQRLRKRPRSVKVDGPLRQAGFVRRSLLSEVGSFTDKFGEQRVATEFAARLRGFGVHCEHVPTCRLVGIEFEPGRGFRAAYHSEKLFWHHRQQFNAAGRVIAHGLHSLVDVSRQLPSPAMIGALAGRAAGMIAGLFSQTADYDRIDSQATLPIHSAQRTSAIKQEDEFVRRRSA